MADEPPGEPHDEYDEYDEPVDPRLVDRPAGGHPMVRAGRRRYGVVGAAMAGAMLALRDLLEKPKDDAAVVVEAASEPTDMDTDGITVPVAPGLAAHAPAQPRPASDPDVARAWTRRHLDRKR